MGPGSYNKSVEHWEQDRWDDHPAAFGADFNFRTSAVTYVPPTQVASAEEGHLNFFQKFLHFLAHPLKTLRGQSTMHGPGQGPDGASPALGTHPEGAVGDRVGSAFGVDRSHSQTPEAWWESRYTDTDWSR